MLIFKIVTRTNANKNKGDEEDESCMIILNIT